MSVDRGEIKRNLIKLELEENNHNSIHNIIDNIQLTNLNNYYYLEESLFKKRIDKLNIKFYLETEKYMSDQADKQKCQDNLFIILLKEISLYIEEIDRLHKVINENHKEFTTKEKLEELNRKEKETFSSKYQVKSLNNTIKQLEKKVTDYIINENKLKNEIESIKRQLAFHNDKLQIEMTMRKAEEIRKKGTLKISKNNINEKESLITNKNSKEILLTNQSGQEIPKEKNTNRKINFNNSNTKFIKKKHDKKEGVEVNNININFNVHLKNSNNANINLGDINSSMIDKKDVGININSGKGIVVNKNSDNKLKDQRLKTLNIQVI